MKNLNENELLHVGIVALQHYKDKYNKLLELNNLEEAKKVLSLAKNFMMIQLIKI